MIGEFDRVPAATVSSVNYSASFAFLGFYIVMASAWCGVFQRSACS